MKQFWLQVVALLVVIFLGLWVSTNPGVLNNLIHQTSSPVTQPPTTANAQKKLVIASESDLTKAVLTAEVADTLTKRGQGLGGRAKLEPNAGMLFLFDKPGRHEFWMRGMKFALDFIWIRGDTIVGTTENVPPPTNTPNETLPILTSSVDVDKILEVNSGFVKFYHINTGDRIKQVQ